MSQSTIPKTALAHYVQSQLRHYLTAHLGHLREQMNVQTYRNLIDLLEGLVRMEAGPRCLVDQSHRHRVIWRGSRTRRSETTGSRLSQSPLEGV